MLERPVVLHRFIVAGHGVLGKYVREAGPLRHCFNSVRTSAFKSAWHYTSLSYDILRVYGRAVELTNGRRVRCNSIYADH